ncbi:MAG: ribosome recycling factor, partial [Vallitaleaceae bacterium]|nr:ribosome recycling factor [Vallitaleaceae bacterium]
NPTNDGKSIRLVFPELTEERRLNLSKDVKKKGEEAKIAIRNIRRDGIEHFKKMEKAHEITEDDLKTLEDDIQKLTDNFTKDIDKHIDDKIKDILTV